MRRLAAIVVLAGLALAGVVLPSSAAAQSQPTTIENFFPRCRNLNDASDVVVGGQAAAGTVRIEMFAPNGTRVAGPTTDDVSNGRYGGSPFVIDPIQTGNYEVRVTGGNGSASAFIEVPCQAPTLEFSPSCFPVGFNGTVTMTGRHFVPYEDGYITYDVNGNETQSAIRIPSDGHGVFSAQFRVAPSNRAHPGEAFDANRGLVGRATWSACPPGTTAPTTTPSTTAPPTTTTTQPGDEPPPTTQPTATTRPVDPPGPSVTIPPSVDLPPATAGSALVVSPELGPAGFVTGVTGSGFPAGSVVTLHWQPGVGLTTLTAGLDGTFTARMLILPNDRLGPRALVATSGTTSAFDAFLVVPSTVQPSGQDVSQINRIRRFNQR